MVWHFYADKEWYISILVYFCQLKSNLIIKKTNLNHSKCAKSNWTEIMAPNTSDTAII